MSATREKVKPCPYAGFQCEGQPKHVDTELPDEGSGIFYYIAEPYGNYVHKNQDFAVLLCSDEHGLWHSSRLLADQFAGAGYLTIVPDHVDRRTVQGSAITGAPHTFDEKTSSARIAEALKYLKVQRNVTKVAAAGYGIGGNAVVSQLGLGDVHIGFVATPTHGRKDFLKTVDGIACPLSLAFADEDTEWDSPRRSEIVNRVRDTSQAYQVNLYSHVPPGFASNRAVSTKAEVYAKKQAFVQALQWFEEHFHNGD
ncbi:uncharacterized protein L3040_001502 [Drepanopeziza brunnea f. sp. 'multigermtubi']|uniref:uncharacterized protein n=1 Tax=Drepanopeziza brunnea f. sp. 'multigermtubi' TaxID=698441 RepID=UPI00239C98E3|nr:hypothetical protein L3040_001502 [Drepanopeziza brunnea f. sp. 'multigermtubi']